MSDPIFEEWKRLTRWWNCMLTAAARERSYWIGAGIKEPKSTELILSHRSNSKFRISVDNYTAVLNDPSMTASLALLMSWGLLEQRGRRALRLNDSDQLPQIEDWGRRVLAGRDATWSQVFGGRKGLVEVAVIRNAVAHGNHRITQRMLNRVQAVGGTLPWGHRQTIRLDTDIVSEYRDRIRSFIRVTRDQEPAQ